MAKRFTSTPDVPRTDGGVTLFRSCLVSAEYPGVEASTKWLFERFGIEYTVNADQTCCTGLGYYSDLMPIQTTVGIAARNACVVVDDEHPVMSYLCSTCYAINKKARNILDVPEYRAETNEVLGQDRARVRRPRRLHRAAQAHPRDPVGRPRQHPRPHPPPPRRHQGRHAPRLPLLQGLPGRDAGQQRELHGAGGDADPRRRHPHRRLQREADALRGRLPQPLRQPVDLGRGDAEEAAPAGRGEGRRPACTCAPTATSSSTATATSSRRAPARSSPSSTCTCSNSSPWRWAPTPRRCVGIQTHSQDVEPFLERIGARSKEVVG